MRGALGEKELLLIDEVINHYLRLDEGEPIDIDDTAWQKMHDLAESEAPKLYWQFLKKLLEDAPATILPYLGADPLDNFVNAHGRTFIGAIEKEALRNPKLTTALGSVIVGKRVPSGVLSRLRSLQPSIRSSQENS